MDSANTPATRPQASSGNEGKPFLGMSFLDNLAQLPMLRQFGLLVGLAASVAIGFAVVLWSQQPDYQILYNDMNRYDSAQVTEILQTSRINYRVDPSTGALLVASEDITDARMRLAGAGVSPRDDNLGFEILDRERGLGTSQFMEAATYKRGLEGEIARTISSMYNIKSARVHIAMPRSTVFVRDDRKPSASVLLEMYSGRALEPSQVTAIVNLVATSVPELGKDEVTVVDQSGTLLSDQSELSELTVAGRQFDYTRRMEESYTRRVNSILQPIVGAGRYRAEVSAEVDFSSVESTAEMFSPESALRSEQVMTEARGAGQQARGIPGALSNQPPGATQVPEQTDSAVEGAPVAVTPVDTREQATRNFELDRQISYTRQQQGRLERLSVAVVVDDSIAVNPETGESTRTPMTEADIARLTRLVQDAVGYNVSRGDSVSVINSPFIAQAELEPLPAIAFWSQPWFWDVAKQILGVLFILVLVFGVLRPVLKNLTNTGRGSDAGYPVGLGGAGGLGDNLRDDQVSLSGLAGGAGAAMLLPPPGSDYEQQLNAIKGLLAEDSGRVAQVVKEWINANE
jgi:flagellar M-ring protein FliF